MSNSNCEYCSNYVFDYYEECFMCQINLDEDEMSRFISDTYYNCPYFSMNDEYKIVRKQM